MDKSGQAFPRAYGGADGLTKREWYAGMALQGILACDNWYYKYRLYNSPCELAFVYADAMLLESAKETKVE